MAKFQFRLEPMKKYRENRLLMGRKDLARLENQLADLTARKKHLEQQRSDLVQEVRAIEHSWADAHLAAELVPLQETRIAGVVREMKFLEDEIERQRRWVAQLGQELRVVEKLEQKQKEAFEAEQVLKEKRRLDGWVAERWRPTPDDSGEVVE